MPEGSLATRRLDGAGRASTGSVASRALPSAAGRLIITLVLWGLVAVMMFPFLYMISMSFMGTFEVFQVPPRFIPSVVRFDNYPRAFSAGPFARFFLNSAVQVFVVVLARVIIASLAGFAFARLSFPGREKLFILTIATMMIPETITLVPNFLMLNALHWIDTFLALTIPLFNYPWGIFLVRQYLLTLPDSLEDAARIDGANDLAIYRKIFLPLSKPVLSVIGVLSFTSVWTSFFWELIVTRSLRMRTISVGVALFAGEHMTYIPDQMVVSTLSSLPVLLIFFLGQRYFMKGITIAGSIK